MTLQDDPTPSAAEPRTAVPDPAQPTLPPITRVNSRILYAAAIFGLIAIWVVTFTVTSRRPQARPAPPPVQDAQPNLDALAGLAERVRASQEMQRKLAAERPGPFDPFRSSLEVPGLPAQETAPPNPLPGPAGGSYPSAPSRPASSTLQYTIEPARPAVASPARSRLDEALSAPPLITPAVRLSTAAGSEPSDPTSRLVDLLDRRLPLDAPAPPGAQAAPQATSAQAPDVGTRLASPERLVHPQSPLSPYVLYEGTTLPAVLTSELTSDLPGIATATLRAPVYDSPSGQHLILPPGTRALGTYDANLAQGDSRLLVAWHRLILPDGRYFEIPSSTGADIHGATGLADQTNRHLGRAFTSTLLLSILGAGAQLSQPSSYTTGYRAPGAGEVAAGALGQELAHVSSDLLQRDLRVKPTLTIRPGTAFGIVLQADLVFSAPYAADPEARP
jgi:type IV secretory pathway VirB10-like protein